ncbi:hypothetical protein AVEN_80536-1 [Araneus ventricosus]|uniref:Reverse transcriptase RNase H-like domain-containing protein n=1 Tax=Araneus ventricosus TaxID=182803 RepID=A0A4Y2HW98_ARAVE|nr:hypothetical protein AVEN_66341-1 [Araneus ventricosus]GBM69289.1 hypothetical protein AVEN_80536-1 [Araneus ventricosus]
MCHRLLQQELGEPEGQIARWIQRLQEYDFEIQHRKETSHGNADALSRRPCKECCKHCTNAEKKFEMETDISVKVLTTEDAWSSSEVQKAQLEDPAIRPILEKKLNSEDRPSWQEIAPESPAIKRYWALWDSLHLKDGILYRWELLSLATNSPEKQDSRSSARDPCQRKWRPFWSYENFEQNPSAILLG